MKVWNESGKLIHAKLSTWGDGMTGYYAIPNGGCESWKRSDPRGR